MITSTSNTQIKELAKLQKKSRLRDEMVHVKNVRLNMEIAACINAGTHAVKLLGGSVDSSYHVVVLAPPCVIPGFVKGAPAYNGGMIVIPV